MVKICPISERIVNENVTRLNASFTFVLSLLFILTGSFWFILAMIIDFSFRLISEGKLSPVIQINSLILKNLNIRKISINAGPKIFAAQIGLLLSSISFIFWYFNYPLLTYSTTGILIFFSFLESVFGFCVACKIYPYALLLNDVKLLK